MNILDLNVLQHASIKRKLVKVQEWKQDKVLLRDGKMLTPSLGWGAGGRGEGI